MPLFSDHATGETFFSPSHPTFRLPVPSRRETQEAWDLLILSIPPSLLSGLSASLEILRRKLNVE
jgi:hypothetical protein